MKFVLKFIFTLKKNNEKMVRFRFRFGNYRNRSVIYRTETETENTGRSVSVR